MGIRIPKGVDIKCDGRDCPIVIEVPIRYIKSAYNLNTIKKKARKEGWYVSEKENTCFCPECREKMGLGKPKRKGDD